MAKPDSILGELAASTHEKVKVAVTDIDGILRGKYLHKEKFLSAAKSGFGFCNALSTLKGATVINTSAFVIHAETIFKWNLYYIGPREGGLCV